MPRAVTPTLLQLEVAECGAAALGIVLAYHGRWVPLPELRERCGVSRDGSRATQILAAAEKYGLKARGLRQPIETIHTLPGPFIAWWQFNHFVVVEGVAPAGVHLNDPAVGHRFVTPEDFADGYTGIVLELTPTPAFVKGGSPPKVVSALSSRLAGNRATVLLCLLAGLLLVVPDLALAALSAAFVDDVLISGKAERLRPIVGLMAAALAVSVGLKWLQLTYLRRLLLDLTARLSGRFMHHLLRLPAAFYGARFAGEISFRAQLNHSVADILSGKLTEAIIAAGSMIIYAVVLALISPTLTLLSAAFAVVTFFALRIAHDARVEANLKRAQDRGKAAGVGILGIQGIEPLKASALEDGFFSRWAGYAVRAEQAHQDLESLNVNLGVLPMMLEGLALAAVWVVGGYYVMGGALTLGLLVAYEVLLHRFLAPVKEIVRLSGSAQELLADMHRLDDVLDCAPVAAGGTASNAASVERLRGAVEVADLTFGYSPVDKPVVRELTFRAGPGQWVALVGRSGSGKTTVAGVLAGLYAPWSGEVRFDGRNRTMIDRDRLSLSVAHVDQNVVLFEGTVRENLTLWDATVPDEFLEAACRDACIDDVISALPGGLDSLLAEGGAGLSVGQRQRLEIARALLHDPAILILDEATSSLDPEVEARLFRNLRRRGCTCVLVAHRLSTIRDADEILVMDAGAVVERGTHAALLAERGDYAELIRTEAE